MLPLEVVEEIVAYLSDDVRSLRTSSKFSPPLIFGTCWLWTLLAGEGLYAVFSSIGPVVSG